MPRSTAIIYFEGKAAALFFDYLIPILPSHSSDDDGKLDVVFVARQVLPPGRRLARRGLLCALGSPAVEAVPTVEESRAGSHEWIAACESGAKLAPAGAIPPARRGAMNELSSLANRFNPKRASAADRAFAEGRRGFARRGSRSARGAERVCRRRAAASSGWWSACRARA